MAEHIDFGVRGEQMARDHLVAKGYRIVKTNYMFRHAEVDIIAEEKGLLVFVEVKTRRGSRYGNPEVFVNKEKRRNMKKAARGYADLYGYVGEIRFDIISVLISAEGRNELVHFPDAFFF